jgi:hypothetical protein
VLAADRRLLQSILLSYYKLLSIPTLTRQLDDNSDSDSDTSDTDSNTQPIDDQMLQALVQHIECSQYAAASDTTTAYNYTDTLLSKWQYIAEQFLTQLQQPMQTAGKKRKHSAVYVAKPQWTPLRNKYINKRETSISTSVCDG